MAEYATVARTDEIPSGSGTVVNFAGEEVAVFNVNGVFYALANSCRHRGGPLGEGALEETIVTCPWHGWQYDVTTGECQTADVRLKTYEVRVEGTAVQIRVP